MLATAFVLGLTLSITIPPAFTEEFSQACNKLFEVKKAKPGASNEACALSLIKAGVNGLILREENKKLNESIRDLTKTLDSKFPEPLPLIVCGDGVLDAGEECDDRNTDSGDGCSARCREE
jgi:cysteine-rich repeat protein